MFQNHGARIIHYLQEKDILSIGNGKHTSQEQKTSSILTGS